MYGKTAQGYDPGKSQLDTTGRPKNARRPELDETRTNRIESSMAETPRSWSSTSAFRWINTSFSLPTSLMRWPSLFSSFFTQSWSDRDGEASPSAFRISLSFSPRSWWWAVNYLDFSLSFVETVIWSLISAVESVALVSMLCFFFLCCGCTL
nr:Transmembrane protein [Ipomoea batatas]